MQHGPSPENPKGLGALGKVSLGSSDLYYSAKVLITTLVLTVAVGALVQNAVTKADGTESPATAVPHEVLDHVIDGIKDAEHAQYLYERIERVETRKQAGDPNPLSVKVSRVIPAGTGIAKITLGPDGKPMDADAYRAELDKLLKSLAWAVATGQPQREAYQKVQKKQKDRDDLLEATRSAFLFSYLGQEVRGDRTLSKYKMLPNPAFKPTNRTTSIFTRVKGSLWVDDAAQQLARVEGEVTDDISLGLFLAKVYKGSRFSQERYEMAPGLWLPSFSQYDFDGRKFFSSFSVHERTFYSEYKRIGSPAEAIPQIQSELSRLNSPKSKPTSD